MVILSIDLESLSDSIFAWQPLYFFVQFVWEVQHFKKGRSDKLHFGCIFPICCNDNVLSLAKKKRSLSPTVLLNFRQFLWNFFWIYGLDQCRQYDDNISIISSWSRAFYYIWIYSIIGFSISLNSFLRLVED